MKNLSYCLMWFLSMVALAVFNAVLVYKNIEADASAGLVFLNIVAMFFCFVAAIVWVPNIVRCLRN